MILYFLRHGKAEDGGGGPDSERRLTARGAGELRAGAATWRRLNLRPNVVICSPLLRARQTAEIFAEAMGIGDRVVTDERLSPGADWSAMAQAMARHPDAGRVMFVGHEPDLSSAAAELTGAASVRMRKGGLACVEFPGTPEPGRGEVAWLIDPDLYAG